MIQAMIDGKVPGHSAIFTLNTYPRVLPDIQKETMKAPTYVSN